MKKLLALLLALVVVSLAACGSAADSAAPETAAASEEAASARALPASAESSADAARDAAPAYEEPDRLDLDLSICQPEEAYREIEHFNIDPSGYRGLLLRVTGVYSAFQDHGRTFYYVGIRDEDGCVENLELRFPGDGSLPAGFPAEGETVTVWGVLDYYATQRDGKDVKSAVLTETRLSAFTWDGRD